MATINVTTTVDENNGVGGAGLSLREAVIQANSNLGEDNIILTAGQTYKLTLAGINEENAATGDLDILAGGKITISTSGDGKATVDAGGIDRVFDVTTQLASLTLKNIVVTGGKSADKFGGGIYNEGNLELESSIVSGNEGYSGGGVSSSGHLNILNSSISGNYAGTGGGIHTYLSGSTTIITNSTVSNNVGLGGGGGIYSRNYSNLTVTNSTISSNQTSAQAGANGGGIYHKSSGNLTVINSTITSNLGFYTGGIINQGGVLNIGNSIVAKNISSYYDDISASTLTSQGNNLIGSSRITFAPIFVLTDKVGVDPLLGPLQNNGGPTATHALLTGSPAINAGNSTLTRDQRGFGRNGIADIGAFEYEGINDLIPPSIISISPADDTTGISPTTDLVINFSEPITKTITGNVFIKKLTDNSIVETIAGGSDKMTVNGSQLIINPGADLAGGTDYYVEISEGVVTDIIGNNFAGITGNTSWNFQTQDTTPPTAISFTPLDNGTGVPLVSDLSINFSEPIQKGTSSIVIKKVADNSVVETIDVATAPNITVNANQLTINPSADLAENTGYYVEIANSAIKDITGNAYTGITGNAIWNFQTQDITAPKAISFTPVDNATGVSLASDLSINFNEPIQKGVGSIVIKKVADNSVLETINITSTNRLVVK